MISPPKRGGPKRFSSFFPSGVGVPVNAISPPDGFFHFLVWLRHKEERVDQREKLALQVTKEIVVKFIEIGRISPGNFPEFFSSIYKEILGTIDSGGDSAPDEEEG
jgi:hypothetical protein